MRFAQPARGLVQRCARRCVRGGVGVRPSKVASAQGLCYFGANIGGADTIAAARWKPHGAPVGPNGDATLLGLTLAFHGDFIEEKEIMRLSPLMAWLYGLLIIFMALVLGQSVLFFGDYIYMLSSYGRNFILMVCWGALLFSGFFASYFSKKHGVILGLLYVIIAPILGAFIHFLYGQLGGVVDFGGLQGAFVLFNISFVLSAWLIGAGIILGGLMSLVKMAKA